MIFDRRRHPSQPPRIPRGTLVYAIGDIHGRVDLFDQLLAMIAADRAERTPARTVIVLLGDLIDRGPDSRGVIERALAISPRDARLGARLVALAGNHEEVLLRLLDGEVGLVDDWLRFGGAQCVASYGLDPVVLAALGARELVATLRSAIGERHREFLEGMGDTLKVGDYLFVHAGVRPGVDLSLQAQQDLRWIRQPFLDDPRDHGFVVVHGHTVTGAVDRRPNRIGIDTGAYASGMLTALALEGDSTWLLQTGSTLPHIAIGHESS